MTGLRLTCGHCGKVNDASLETLGERAHEDAARVTDGQLAARYREALEAALRGIVPPGYRDTIVRLPLGWVRNMSDERAIVLGRAVLGVMLKPPE